MESGYSEEDTRARRMAKALARLPAVQREAVVLFELEDFTMEEISAANGITNVRCAGRSPDEIASDIRSQLESAGVTGADVDVTSEGDRTRICVLVQGNECGGLPEIQCETDENPDARHAKIKVCRTPRMTDTGVVADIERRLREQGLSGTVTLDGSGCSKSWTSRVAPEPRCHHSPGFRVRPGLLHRASF